MEIEEPSKKIEVTSKEYKYSYPLSYSGNIIWPIIFLFLFPPVGIVLFLLYTCFTRSGICYELHYKGSTFWLIFWTIFFFPIAIILAIYNGFDVIGRDV